MVRSGQISGICFEGRADLQVGLDMGCERRAVKDDSEVWDLSSWLNGGTAY